MTVAAQDTNKHKDTEPISNEAIFKVAKEIVVKFIEVGRMTPASFEDDFARIYRAVERAVRGT